MENKAYMAFNKARAFAGVEIPVLCLLGCEYIALGYLSGKLYACIAFSPCFIHDHHYAVFTGSLASIG